MSTKKNEYRYHQTVCRRFMIIQLEYRKRHTGLHHPTLFCREASSRKTPSVCSRLCVNGNRVARDVGGGGDSHSRAI